jgi:hypothetical protein
MGATSASGSTARSNSSCGGRVLLHGWIRKSSTFLLRYPTFRRRCIRVLSNLPPASCTSGPTLVPACQRSRTLGLLFCFHAGGADGQRTAAEFLSRRSALQVEVCQGEHHRNPPQDNSPSPVSRAVGGSCRHGLGKPLSLMGAHPAFQDKSMRAHPFQSSSQVAKSD